MPADGIIKAVDISGDGIFGMAALGVAGAPDEFGFDRLEDRFHHGIRCRIAAPWPGVPAIPANRVLPCSLASSQPAG